jgi:hypothetical protein
MASAKRAVIELVQGLPERASLEDIQYQLYLRQKLERSEQALRAGRTKTHAQVKKRLARWLGR